jgi:hypothetical protein
MNLPPSPNTQLLEAVAGRIAPLLDEVVFVGGQVVERDTVADVLERGSRAAAPERRHVPEGASRQRRRSGIPSVIRRSFRPSIKLG